MSIATEVMLGIAGPSLRQGAAGTVYFEPGGVSFWDYQRPNRRRWLVRTRPAPQVGAIFHEDRSSSSGGLDLQVRLPIPGQ